MRTANPALNERAFRGGTAVMDAPVRLDEHGVPTFAGPATRMTVEGVVYKTALLLVVAVLAAGFTWTRTAGAGVSPGLLALAFFGLLGTGIATAFRPRIAIVTGPLYALASGAFIGVVSSYFEAAYPGIALQAGVATLMTLAAMLGAYATGLIKATPNFIRGVVTATVAILLIYVATIVLGLFGVQMPLLHSSGPLGILVSLLIVGVAALNLILDFHVIEQLTAQGAEKRMEWYGAFALLVTLVWLYLELLRLIAKLRD
jgi:uncharacterized YccA/Bax inhibitor family protein